MLILSNKIYCSLNFWRCCKFNYSHLPRSPHLIFADTKNTCGSALISALFIMTLVAIAAVAMSMRLQLDIYRTRLTILSDKLYFASQAVSFWAMGELSLPTKQLAINDQDKVLKFPKQFHAIYPGVTITGYMNDLQSRFNLNNLQDTQYYPVFLKLLQTVIPSMSLKEREAIVFATKQWISPYVPSANNDELINYYLKQAPPYYPGQQPFQSLSEFRLIRKINASIYQLLNNYLTVLPEVTPINIKTASKQTLMSLSPTSNEADINEFLAIREKGELLNNKTMGLLLQKFAIPNKLVTLDSQYFTSVATIIHEELTLVNISIFKRQINKNGTLSVSLIAETLNLT